jgi:hypothetical protein
MKQLQRVNIKAISADDKRFCFTQTETLSAVFSGIPLLWQQGDTYIPVLSGTVDPGNGDEVTAWVYSSGTRLETILREQTDIMLRLGTLTPFDMARILDLLETYQDDYNKAAWCKYLQIGISQIPDYLTLLDYDSSWEQYFQQKKVPLKRILSFFDPALREQLQPLLSLNPGINVLEQISDCLQGAARREKRSIREVWTDCIPSGLPENRELGKADILSEIRQRLYRRRYPVISDHQAHLQNALDALNVPSGLQVSADPFFETPGVNIRFHAENAEDLEKQICWLKAHREQLKSITNISHIRIADEE